MADYKKYKVGITVKEPWANNISYEQLDMTLFAVENGGDGCAYVALKPNIGVRPNQDPTTWIKATQRGQSIYDYCIEYGLFEGTEEKFAQDYADAVQAAKDAAASATHVGEEVSAAEQGRVSAENARVSAESQRASAEESRVSSESQRSVNETGRVNAEDSRVAAENARVVAESQRVNAESTRATNEESRRAEFGGMMRDAETAIGLVDAAMTEAENVDATVDGLIVTITDRHGVSKSVNIGFDIYRTYGSVAAMNADAANVEDGKFVMIATLDPTSTENAQLWVRNSNAATSQNPFTFLSDLDQASSAAWADWMENQKPIIEADHTTAVADHTQAVSDHTNATNDHAVAGQDHTTAGTDHTQAVSDSTRAGQDHSVAEQDHTRAEGDHTTASTDHSTAQSDHTTAETDRTTASSDHIIASGDHTTALSDHDIASGDHTIAVTDHTRSESDHAAVELYVDSLGVFDLSKHNAVGGVLATYADLPAALTALNALEPKYKYGGMSFKFVSSVDNKYVQYRCKKQSFSANPEDWYFEGDDTLVYSPEFIEAVTDNDDKVLESRKKDGTKVEYCDFEVKGHFINEEIQRQIDSKIDKVKDGINNEEILSYFESTESPEWQQGVIDSEKKILEAYDIVGNKKIFTDVEVIGRLKANNFVSDYSNIFIQYLKASDFTENYNEKPFSGFINIEDADEMIINVGGKLPNYIVFPIFLDIDKPISFSTDEAQHDLCFKSYGVDRIKTRVKIPQGYRWLSFLSNGVTNDDYIVLIKRPSISNDWRKVQRFCDLAKCVSDDYQNACGEPQYLYDPKKGIVYETYQYGGEGITSEIGGYVGFAKFPLCQPERAEYKQLIQSGETTIGEYKVSFRDDTIFWGNDSYTLIKCLTYGNTNEQGDDWCLRIFDLTTDGTPSNFSKVTWKDSGEFVNYSTYRSHVQGVGLTPYGDGTETHELCVHGTHVQDYNGYKYFVICSVDQCPLVCRTNDDFVTIEAVGGMQIDADYEATLIINDSDFYMVARGAALCYYAYSTDAGASWSTPTSVPNSVNSKPAGIMYDGKPVFVVPTRWCQGFGSITINDEDNIITSYRAGVVFIRGDKTLSIDAWKQEFVLYSKFGVNYNDLFAVGKEIYFGYTCDKSHSRDLLGNNQSLNGKAQIMFGRVGNFDNMNLFGDC